jgi:succinoglycan biosynthesis transport protein ExoP
LTPDTECGFLDVIAGRANLSDVVRTYADGKLSFLPPGLMARLPNAVDFFNSEAAKSLFDTLQLKYDYVIVDLAPAVSTLEVRAASRLVDSYLLVIEWGQTKVDAIQYALRNAPELQDRIVGAVLNKVDLAMMSRYDNYGSRYYDQSYPTVR